MKKIASFMLIMMTTLSLFACKDQEEEPVIVKDYVVTPTVTTGNKEKLLSVENSIDSIRGLSDALNQITIDETITYQVMDGFGAAMTESSAYLLASLEEPLQSEVMADLFDYIGISMLRVPMGASDFAFDNYSYDDMPEGEVDPELAHFNITRDQAYVIPMLKVAQSYNPDLLLMGSPWSAPAWMKDSKTMNGGSLKTAYEGVYADYFVKFIEAYQHEGLNIWAVTPQNEPLHQTSGYPTMYMTATQQVSLINKLGTRFETKGIDTLIIGYDHNWDNTSYPSAVLNGINSRDYIDGSAWHCYAGEVGTQSLINDMYPDKGIWFTECSGGQWSTNFSNNMSWNMENLFIGSVNHYAKGVLFWNLALDPSYGPQNGGCTNCRGALTIDLENQEVIKNEEYYSIAHLSKFVKRGAIRIDAISSHPSLIVSAFKNPDGTIAVVLHNKATQTLNVDLVINGSYISYQITGKTTVSFILGEK